MPLISGQYNQARRDAAAPNCNGPGATHCTSASRRRRNCRSLAAAPVIPSRFANTQGAVQAPPLMSVSLLMKTETAPAFLAQIPVFAEFEDVANPARYRPLPEGWVLAMADVVSSGKAIENGKYKMVNMAGASVITAVLNALGRADYPFVFGGDGAVIAAPGERADEVREALAAVARWIDEDLRLEMRVALIPVADIRAAGHDVLVARLRSSPDLTFAMLAGGGAAWAEAQMKQGRFSVAMAPPGSKPDLTGLSCRWNPIESQNGQIVSIIAAQGTNGSTHEFEAVVAKIIAIAGGFGNASNPVPEKGPKPRFYLGGLAAEVYARAAKGRRWRAGAKVVFEILMTLLSYWTNLTIGGFNARTYGRELGRNSDFRKYDDGLKMTIDIDDAGFREIEQSLAEAAEKGVCTYGLHRQASALVTCIVPSHRSADHMHFIDGAGGGYAQAASEMKAKVAARSLQGKIVI
jgi:hypothetical protein